MHMTPYDAANVAMPVDDIQELVGILQPDMVEPAARHRHRMMMQTNERMPLWRAREGRLQGSELLRAEAAARRPRHGAVEQHDSPQPEIDVSADDERRAIELASHCLRLVVIAGQAENREPQRSEEVPEVSISRGVVLHEIARDQQPIGRPVVAPLGVQQRCLERGQCRNAAQQLALAAVEVGVCEMCQAHYTHLKSLAETPYRPAVNWVASTHLRAEAEPIFVTVSRCPCTCDGRSQTPTEHKSPGRVFATIVMVLRHSET